MEGAIDVAAERDDDKVMMLLVDDSKSSHILLSTILKRFSCELDSAWNGAEAVGKIKNGSYDLIFMDSHMPVMDGMTAIREIRGFERSVGAGHSPIVMITEDDSAEYI
jgi:CheY-like chemotaxis protein